MTIDNLQDRMDELNRCEHPRTEIRKKTTSQGAMYKHQCLDCGRGVGAWLPHAKVPNRLTVVEWDDSLEQSEWSIAKEINAERQRLQQAKKSDWWIRYNEHVSLSNPVWAHKRERVLERDKWICQACLRSQATQVHHLTYEHVFDEPLFDLISVCAQCHEKLHHKDDQEVA